MSSLVTDNNNSNPPPPPPKANLKKGKEESPPPPIWYDLQFKDDGDWNTARSMYDNYDEDGDRLYDTGVKYINFKGRIMRGDEVITDWDSLGYQQQQDCYIVLPSSQRATKFERLVHNRNHMVQEEDGQWVHVDRYSDIVGTMLIGTGVTIFEDNPDPNPRDLFADPGDYATVYEPPEELPDGHAEDPLPDPQSYGISWTNVDPNNGLAASFFRYHHSSANNEYRHLTMNPFVPPAKPAESTLGKRNEPDLKLRF